MSIDLGSEAPFFALPGVDGRDIDARGANERPSLTCRIYYLPDARVSPIPSREQMEAALK